MFEDYQMQGFQQLRSSQPFPADVQVHQSDITVYPMNLEWRIAQWNFHNYIHRCFESEPFYCSTISDFALRMYLKEKRDDNNVSYFGLFLMVAEYGSVKEVSVRFGFEIQLDNGSKIGDVTNKNRHITNRENNSYRGFGHARFAQRLVLEASENLVIRAHVEFSVEESIEKKQVKPDPEVEPFYQLENGDFSDMINDSHFSDLTVETCDSSISVHKVLLSIRSEVFRAMILNDCKECHSSVIRIDNFSTDTVRLFLTYLYGGKLEGESLKTHALELLKMAHMYQVKQLVDLTSSCLARQLSSINIVDCVRLAWLYDCLDLKLACIRTIRKSPDEVLASDEWLDLTKDSPDVSLELMRLILKRPNTESVAVSAAASANIPVKKSKSG